MRARQRVALAGALAMVSPVLVGPVLAPAADAVTQVAARPGPGNKPARAAKKPAKPEKPEKAERADGRKQSDDKQGDKKRGAARRDRKPPATPVLGGPGVGAGGAVSLPVIAESGSSVAVAELGGSVVATGTGTGGYSSLSWTTSHGTHSYVVTATDGAGNRSGAAQTSVQVDAIAPRLSGIRLTPGTPSDTRTRLRFTTDAGSAYRVLVDGKQVASGTVGGRRAERFLDIADGRHPVQVAVRDATGNTRTGTRPVAVRIPELAVETGFASPPTKRTQAVRVRATPTATRGFVRLPGQDPVTFVVRRGQARVELDLPDGTYRAGTVRVRDTRGRTGRSRLPALTVDTIPPTLDVAPDAGAAADGVVRAAVTAEADTEVRWRLVDAAGEVVGSGAVSTEDGTGTVTADVEKGQYRLVVAATDAFDRTTKVRTSSDVADDPWPSWLVVLLRLGAAVAALLAVAGLVLLVRWATRPDSPVRPALAATGRAAVRRLRVLVAPVPERDATATVAALFEPEEEAPRIPFPRAPSRAGGVLPADGEVVHRTPVRLYETTEERDDGPVLGSRSAELVVSEERIALVDSSTGDIWSGRIAMLAHVRDDTTMVLLQGQDDWIGLVYTDPEVTRPALDLVSADRPEPRLAPAGRARA